MKNNHILNSQHFFFFFDQKREEKYIDRKTKVQRKEEISFPHHKTDDQTARKLQLNVAIALILYLLFEDCC